MAADTRLFWYIRLADLIIKFYNSIKFYNATQDCKCLNKVIHQVVRNMLVDPLNKFYGKGWNGFCLIIGKRFLVEILF